MKKQLTILMTTIFLTPLIALGQNSREKTVHSSDDQIQAFMQFPKDQPLLMVNLVKFKDKVDTGETGREMYERYVKAAQPFADKIGAEIVWYGKPLYNVIAPDDEVLWDAMFVVKYKDINGFFQMAQSSEIPGHLRAKSLEDARLIACSPQDNFLKK